MVDVGQKHETERMARASGVVVLHPETLKRIRDSRIEKGDVIGVARLAGIMAAKRTHELIPLCHVLALTSVEIGFDFPNDHSIAIESRVRSRGRTGVEMEALSAVTTAALTIYDMCKAIDRDIELQDVRLEEKSGGKSGHYVRNTHRSTSSTEPNNR